MNRNQPKHNQAESTKDVLLRRAESSFTANGYAKTSINDISKQEQLTKGAFYYYFKDKRALFEEVVDRLLVGMQGRITAAIDHISDPWERALIALDTYLEGCLQPSYRRIVLQEAPVILGWAEWRQKEKQSIMSLSAMLLQEIMDAGQMKKQPIDILVYLLFGAITEAALGIADSDDQEATRSQAKQIIQRMLRSL